MFSLYLLLFAIKAFLLVNGRDVKEFEKAEVQLNNALEKAKTDSELLFYKGIFELHKRQYVEAYNHFSNVNINNN